MQLQLLYALHVMPDDLSYQTSIFPLTAQTIQEMGDIEKPQ